jgi:hypothetical protein
MKQNDAIWTWFLKEMRENDERVGNVNRIINVATSILIGISAVNYLVGVHEVTEPSL